MLTVNRLKEKLRTGQKVFGLIASIPVALTVEMIGHAGYDFVIIDMEHVMINPETVEHMIRAAEATYITTLMRVPEVDTKQILRVLDSGAQGIVIPHVESREQMEKLVQAAKYSPLGKRSLSSGRPAAFGKGSLVDYMKQANEQIMLVPMIESRLGVERIADILSVQGLDMVLEGAADLSQSYGMPWQTDAAVVQEGLQRVWEASRAAHIPYCAIPRKTGQYDAWVKQGVHAFVLGDERGIAFRALQARRSNLC